MILEALVFLVLQHVDNPTILPVLQCESGIKQYKEDGSLLIGAAGEIGIAQFKEKTWEWMNGMRGTHLDIQNPLAQINMIDWAFTNGYESHWTCYNQLINKT